MQLPCILSAIPGWHQLSASERKTCWRAATALVASMQSLSEQGEHVVQAVLQQRSFIEWEHYPEQDVRDMRHASHYFYHAHSGAQRPFEEHGHFHLFVYADEMGLRRAHPRHEMAPAHLLAVSMDAQGLPSGFFCVNRWVTKGPWLNASECERGLDHFQVKGRNGQKAVNTFLRALLTLYRPHTMALLQQREQILHKLSEGRDRRSVFADKEIEVLCYLPIQLMQDIETLEALM